MNLLLIRGSASHIPLADESVQTCVTSPPYWGLRQYAGEQREVWGGDPEHAHEWRETAPREAYVSKAKWQHSSNGRGEEQPTEKRLRDPITREARPEAWGEITNGAWCACGAWYGALGLEPTPQLYVEHMVAIFRGVRRVLRKDGTLWLNLGDSYNNRAVSRQSSHQGGLGFTSDDLSKSWAEQSANGRVRMSLTSGGLKEKDLVGIPWMVAFALRADGWYLRSDIVWAKPNPMPESVTDRPTKSHEYLFLLTKSERYFYDADAIREPSITNDPRRPYTSEGEWQMDGRPEESRKSGQRRSGDDFSGRNKRTVWTIPTRPYPGAHFATYPEQLVEPCILAGTSPKACGVCGAPWERVTERTPMVMRPSERRTSWQDEQPDLARTQTGGTMVDPPTSRTTGWRSTCEHEDDTGACVVLDPFNGSGTTGRVAVRHGRSYVGVDIAQEYLVEQSKARIDNIQHTLGLEAAL